MLAVAKMLIASKWKQKSVPIISSWYHKLCNFFVLEKITNRVKCQLLGKTNLSFASTWYVFVEYMVKHQYLLEKSINKYMISPLI